MRTSPDRHPERQRTVGPAGYRRSPIGRRPMRGWHQKRSLTPTGFAEGFFSFASE